MTRAVAAALLVLLTACEMVSPGEGGVPSGAGRADAAAVQAAGSRAIPPDGPVPFVVPAASTIPTGPVGDAVRRGKALLEHTRDSLPRFVGNDLNCTNCHMDGGTRKDAMPWIGVYSRFPQYRSRTGAVIVLEDRLKDCFERSMNGRAPAHDSKDMKDMVAYLAWLSRDVPVGRDVEGQGMPAVAPLAPDTVRGREVYLAECARCHGADGQGLVPPAPPLWGPRSFNIGAGMARLRTAASFLKVAMPYDRPGTLTDQQAYDVAAYMNGQGRPDFPGKEADWPNGDPPPDVAYPTRAARRR